MLEWVRDGEAVLSGTAAVLAGVGVLIHQDQEHKVGDGEVGPLTRALRARLIAVQNGETPDRNGWISRI
jgi:branched-chain amino acid aminotransferase